MLWTDGSDRYAALFPRDAEPDTGKMCATTLDAGARQMSSGKKSDLHEHMNMIAREFSGVPVLLFFHAGIIVHLRRRIDVDINLNRFNQLWSDHSEFLLRNLDSRWLVSAADTIADYSADESERAGALAATLLVATIKLYETEHIALDIVPTRCRPITGGIALFDGLTAFKIGRGDMVKNLFDRVDRVVSAEPRGVALRILKELLGRARRHDTVFRRLAEVHEAKKTSW